MAVIRSCFLVCCYTVLLLGCGGSATPTGGASTPVAIELPAISFPTSIGTSTSAVTGDLSLPPPSKALHLAKAEIDLPLAASSFEQLYLTGPQNYDRVSTSLDRLLSIFSTMSCTTAQCSFNNGNIPIKVDFTPISLVASFSENNTGLNLSRTCVAIDTALTSSTAYCARVWVGGSQYLVGQFTVRPTSTDKGAGWFISKDSTGAAFGVIYDKSTATAAETSRPYSIVEMFVTVPGVITNDHFFITETKVGSSSTPLVNFGQHDQPTGKGSFLYTARWFDKWYGNIKFASEGVDESGVCLTLAGVRTTGCSSTLTSPALPSYIGAAVDADQAFPSAALFPTSPTFDESVAPSRVLSE